MKRVKRTINPTLPTSGLLSTATVAKALGVSVTTVKRWVDEEILPAHRTAGGHRKLLAADVLQASRAGRLPQADLSALETVPVKSVDVHTLAAEFKAAIDRIDLDAVRSVILKGHAAALPMETLADDLLSPGLEYLGVLWARGTVDVMAEHRISNACQQALHEVETKRAVTARVGRPVAVGGAVEGDYTVLPTLLARLTLLECGWDAINLGPHTPFDALLSAMDEYRPRLVWLSIAHLLDAERFLAEHAAFFDEATRRNVAVAIGGSGLTAELRTKMRYTTYGDGLTQFAAFARSLNPLPTPRKRGRPRKVN